ncbi:hypothetical protein ACSBR1_036126 [Camellia fascicularis]
MESLTSCLEHAVKPNTLRSYLAEFISTIRFVFVVVGSTMSSRKMMLVAVTNPSALVAVVAANAFALSVALYAAANIFGRHVNPAVTFRTAVRGHITVPMAIFFTGFHRANVLAFRPFTGRSMNPAYSFGSALVGGSFKNHVVYLVGPLIGAALAGILYDNVVFPAMASLTSRLEHVVKPNALRSCLAEFISTFLFVFAIVGSAMSFRKMMPDAVTDTSALAVVAVANVFAFSMAVTQRLISPAAIYHRLHSLCSRGPETWSIGSNWTLSNRVHYRSQCIGIQAIYGGSTNVAYSFGSALVGGSFKNRVVYWVGPLISAALAGILYDNVVFPVQVPRIADGVGV